MPDGENNPKVRWRARVETSVVLSWWEMACALSRTSPVGFLSQHHPASLDHSGASPPPNFAVQGHLFPTELHVLLTLLCESRPSKSSIHSFNSGLLSPTVCQPLHTEKEKRIRNGSQSREEKDKANSSVCCRLIGELTIFLEQKLGDSLPRRFFIHQICIAVYQVWGSGFRVMNRTWSFSSSEKGDRQ